jgi:tetratricopeptide (TPR) repeat protein
MEKPFETLKRLENELNQALVEDNLSNISTKYLKLGEFCLEIDAVEYGINIIQKAVMYDKKLPKMHSFYELLGHLYYKHGKLEEALDSYKKYIKQIPKGENHNNHASVLFNMGKILMLIEKYEAAIKTFKKSEKIYEHYGEHLKQAQLLYDIGVECDRGTIINQPKIISYIMEKEFKIKSQDSKFKKYCQEFFQKALKILETQNLLETERELANKIQSKI